MGTRRFGRSGLQVSQVVLGAGYVGGLFVLADDETRRRVLRRALDAGINWIDTAPLYGQGRSEEALGWLLAEVKDRKPHLSTKVRLDLSKPGDLPGQIERSLHESLKRLRRDSVDLLQLHNAIDAAGVDHLLKKGGAADGLERMREQGLTRYVGLTALGDAPAIVRAIDSGRFDSAQVYYNLLNPSAARSMPAGWVGHDFAGVCAACKRHDVAMMNIRVFASGVLATDERHGREVVLTENSALEVETERAHAALAALGAGYGTRAQTALRFSLSNPDLACVVIGLAEPSHLEEAIAAEAMGPLPAAAIAKLEAVYARGFA
jgi:L-galactose dehydrogenase/L-glyceraldehyde 3-phosphate reductase